MNGRFRIGFYLSAFVAIAAFTIAGLAYGVSVSDETKKGLWPDTWPKALEPLRDQARTYVVQTAYLGTTNHTVYEIEFTSRDQFEKMWPEILKVRDKGSPITLSASPSFHDVLTGTVDAGVRIWAPLIGPAREHAEKRFKYGPPWPDSIYLPSGLLPDYATIEDNGKWIPLRDDPREEILKMRWKVRTDIELVVDGNIVDLNRISLPPDTPLIDNRASDRERAERRKMEETD